MKIFPAVSTPKPPRPSSSTSSPPPLAAAAPAHYGRRCSCPWPRRPLAPVAAPPTGQGRRSTTALVPASCGRRWRRSWAWPGDRFLPRRQWPGMSSVRRRRGLEAPRRPTGRAGEEARARREEERVGRERRKGGERETKRWGGGDMSLHVGARLQKAKLAPQVPPGFLGLGWGCRRRFLLHPAKKETLGARVGRFLSTGAQKRAWEGFLGGGWRCSHGFLRRVSDMLGLRCLHSTLPLVLMGIHNLIVTSAIWIEVIVFSLLYTCNYLCYKSSSTVCVSIPI